MDLKQQNRIEYLFKHSVRGRVIGKSELKHLSHRTVIVFKREYSSE